jgi:hypothetical protein
MREVCIAKLRLFVRWSDKVVERKGSGVDVQGVDEFTTRF